MSEMLMTLLGCGAIMSALGAWLGSKLTKDKYKAEVRSMVADACTKELDNVRTANEALTEVINSLQKICNGLRRDVDKLRKAVEKIPSCPYSDDCPVSRQLQRSEEDTKAGEDK